MKIIKRSGKEDVFDRAKIIAAVGKANITVIEAEQLSSETIAKIASDIETRCAGMNRAVDVETIQDWVEIEIMKYGAFTVAKNYITYRYERGLLRQSNTTDQKILSLLNFENEEVKQENSNKNPIVNSVQRDYMAGEVSKDITTRFLLPHDITDAHREGIIHFHDADYFAQHMHNCCLVNLEDMLQNGTVISETMIEKPHSFSTACNISTQIIAQIEVLNTVVRVLPCPTWHHLCRPAVRSSAVMFAANLNVWEKIPMMKRSTRSLKCVSGTRSFRVYR